MLFLEFFQGDKFKEGDRRAEGGMQVLERWTLAMLGRSCESDLQRRSD